MPSTAPVIDTALPSAPLILGRPTARRGFLSGLASLPLIGGSVALIGKPRAVAEPVTPDLLEAYKTWLEYEKRWLVWAMADDPTFQKMYCGVASANDRKDLSEKIGRYFWHAGAVGGYHGGPHRTSPYTRAALVMSTVGCDWREREG